jgi:hypothetical protein
LLDCEKESCDQSQHSKISTTAMTLATGTKLGRSVIRAPLGAGGMGEVYLAQETKLKRSVVAL